MGLDMEILKRSVFFALLVDANATDKRFEPMGFWRLAG